eukprot:12177632-Prorocentrum_lima.AAC.1
MTEEGPRGGPGNWAKWGGPLVCARCGHGRVPVAGVRRVHGGPPERAVQRQSGVHKQGTHLHMTSGV